MPTMVTPLERLEGAYGPYAALLAREAIQDAVAEERERAAKIAEGRARKNAECPPGCRCGDGHHIAAAIRADPQG